MAEPNIFYGPHPTGETYTTGTGQELVHVHKVDEDCIHYGCVIHQPSDHLMLEWPTYWRHSAQLMMRVCPHDVGHPDPDQLGYIRRRYGKAAAAAEGVHGCDGCCTGNGPP